MTALFSNHPVFATLAIVGTFLYLLKLVLLLVGGDGDGGEGLDFEGDTHIDGGESFEILSIQSILAFFMGAGWIGLAAKIEWQLSVPAVYGSSAGFGFAMAALNAWLMMKVKGLNKEKHFDIRNAIGNSGRAYIDIPAKGDGMGQVEVNIQGRKQIHQAVSDGEGIKSFSNVKVIDIDQTGALIVRQE